MQITIKSTRVIKEGERKDGSPYKWYSVIADDGSEKGTEYTTFDGKAGHLGAGAVIDIGDIITKGGKLSFKEVVNVISEGKALAKEPNGGGGYKRDTDAIRLEYELKAQMQATERASIEAQTAYNGAISLLANGVPDDGKELVKDAIAWGRTKLKAQPGVATPVVSVKKAPPAIKVSGDIPSFANGVDLVNYALKHGFTMEKIRSELAIEKPADIKAVEIAAAVLFGVPKNNPDPEGLFAEDKAQ